MWLYLSIPVILMSITYKNQLASLAKMLYNDGPKEGLRWINQLLTHWLYQQLVEVHRNYYIVHYPLGVSWYKIIIPRRRGPSRITQILDHQGRDIKEDLFAHLGPGKDFHGQPITPEMLGHQQLTIIQGPQELIFENNDKITI
jgi:hypothetical protein